jgi:hypothetical protein
MEFGLSIFYSDRLVDAIVWDAYFLAKMAVYEVLFCALFWLISKGKERYIGLFAFIVSFASCVDLILLKNNLFLQSDYLVVAASFLITLVVYGINNNILVFSDFFGRHYRNVNEGDTSSMDMSKH